MIDDPMGDNDELVIEAQAKLRWAIGYGSKADQVQAIDDLIQARIVLALETLTDATFGLSKAQ